MTFTYWLPDEQGEKWECRTSNNSVIIIGANGSGKSRLGAWIESQDSENIHRIGAQRNLNFNEDIVLKSYSQAENFVFYGTDDKGLLKEKTKVTDGNGANIRLNCWMILKMCLRLCWR